MISRYRLNLNVLFSNVLLNAKAANTHRPNAQFALQLQKIFRFAMKPKLHALMVISMIQPVIAA